MSPLDFLRVDLRKAKRDKTSEAAAQLAARKGEIEHARVKERSLQLMRELGWI